MRYFQCVLHQGDIRLVGWIEERGAKEGLVIDIKGKQGLWRVARVFEENPIDASWLNEKRRRDRSGLASIRSRG